MHDYIALDSHFYAQKVTLTIIEKSESLNEFPSMGRVVPEIDDNKIREIFIYSYRLIYEIQKDDVLIHDIIHGKRDFDEAMK
ncbi:MAG: type II toxin-antitoxin system RelE/ParE family toxin [bacterium]|nr:type II toxin-antitoxin system RelE/ParE family toxin [bacterium]